MKSGVSRISSSVAYRLSRAVSWCPILPKGVKMAYGLSASVLVSLQTANILNICCECRTTFAVNADYYYGRPME